MLSREQETVQALASLAKAILDPVTQHFERPKLTYAFSGPTNIAKITRNIAPRVDQHASFERQRNGKRICAFDGAAADFQVRGCASTMVDAQPRTWKSAAAPSKAHILFPLR